MQKKVIGAAGMLLLFSSLYSMQDGSLSPTIDVEDSSENTIELEGQSAPVNWLAFTREQIRSQVAKNDLGVTESLNSKYIQFYGSLFKGHRAHILGAPVQIKHIERSNVQENPALLAQRKQMLAAEYKIHLMPASADEMRSTIGRLIALLKDNPQLQQSVHAIKFYTGLHDNMGHYEIVNMLRVGTTNTYLPLVVIYAATGKNNAQYVLNTMYEQFTDMKGLGLVPRYNVKFTDFLYALQGNGDDRNDLVWRHKHFDPSFNYTYFKLNFERSIGPHNYMLTDPSKHSKLKRHRRSRK